MRWPSRVEPGERIVSSLPSKVVWAEGEVLARDWEVAWGIRGKGKAGVPAGEGICAEGGEELDLHPEGIGRAGNRWCALDFIYPFRRDAFAVCHGGSSVVTFPWSARLLRVGLSRWEPYLIADVSGA